MSEIRVPADVFRDIGEVVTRLKAQGPTHQGIPVEGLEVIVKDGYCELVDGAGSYGGKRW